MIRQELTILATSVVVYGIVLAIAATIGGLIR